MPIPFFVSLPETRAVVVSVGFARAEFIAIALVAVAVVPVTDRVVPVAVTAILETHVESALVPGGVRVNHTARAAAQRQTLHQSVEDLRGAVRERLDVNANARRYMLPASGALAAIGMGLGWLLS